MTKAETTLFDKQDPREQYYRRNFITFLLESFFFTFALTIFSHSTILPVYISNITSNSFWISLIGVVYFGFSNISSILSCVIGVNAKSTKWITITICGLQRFGQLLIFLSTFAITNNQQTALTVFFFSYVIYSVTAGMSLPVFSNLVSRVIHRNVSNFYGSYSLLGSLAGVIASQLVSYLIEHYAFPINYRYMFLAGLLMAVIATVVLIVGVKELPSTETPEKLRFRDLPTVFKEIFKDNKLFRNFMLTRMITAAAEMTIPFYIIKVSMFENAKPGIVGIMSTVLLISNLLSSKVLGYIGDKKGPYFLIRLGSITGLAASFLSIVMKTHVLGYILFVLVSVSVSAISLSNNVSIIVYSKKGFVPVYSAFSGLLIAPIYSIFSFGGGLVANQSSVDVIFAISGILYALAFVLNVFMEKKITTG